MCSISQLLKGDFFYKITLFILKTIHFFIFFYLHNIELLQNI